MVLMKTMSKNTLEKQRKLIRRSEKDQSLQSLQGAKAPRRAARALNDQNQAPRKLPRNPIPSPSQSRSPIPSLGPRIEKLKTRKNDLTSDLYLRIYVY